MVDYPLYKINVTLASGDRQCISHWSGYFIGWPSSKEGVLNAIRSDMAVDLLKVDLVRQKERDSIATVFGHFMQLVEEYDLPERPTQNEEFNGFTQVTCRQVGGDLGIHPSRLFRGRSTYLPRNLWTPWSLNYEY